MIKAYPLTWPEGWPRTSSYQRKDGLFKRDRDRISIPEAVARVRTELERLNIVDDDMIISTNVPTRLDGFPRGDQAAPSDPGAAVYWRTRKGAQRVMAIDRYNKLADNLAAIAATLEAMRAIERHGGAQILDRAFTGFTALPAPGHTTHWSVLLGVSAGERDQSVIKNAYRVAASRCHPDRQGGSLAAMQAINRAWEDAQKELGA